MWLLGSPLARRDDGVGEEWRLAKLTFFSEEEMLNRRASPLPRDGIPRMQFRKRAVQHLLA